MASNNAVIERADIHPFPAATVGALLRAMADPEGKGDITDERAHDIAKIEARLLESQRRDKPREEGP